MIKNYSTDLAEYIDNLTIIENNHKLKKQDRARQLEKISDYVIYSLVVAVVFLIYVQVFGV